MLSAIKKIFFRNEYDFSGQDLSGRDFSNKILIGADFSNTNCTKCNFTGADLSFATFKNSNLYEAKFDLAVLYVTIFENTNLTRASFNKSFLYGIKFHPYVNVTYCSFNEIQLEQRRRISIVKPIQPFIKDYITIKFGSNISQSGPLVSYDKFCCNNYYFDVKDWEKHEQELHKSQIYNRLKRIFKENYFLKESAGYYFLERYWLTRSWHKQDFSGVTIGKKYIRFIKTIFSKLSEIVCGYGEKPQYVLGWIFSCWIIYALIYLFGSFEIPLSYSENYLDILWESMYYSACTLVTLSTDVKPLGLTKIFTASEAMLGIILFAILTATIVRKIIRD